MLNLRRGLLAAPLLAALLGACASFPPTAPTEVRAVLAPTGTLRVAAYPGSPTSLLRTTGSEEMRGLAVDIGRELARRLGVPVQIVIFPRVAEVVAGLRAGQADVTITNATPARAADVDFSAPLVGLELGYLALPDSKVQALDEVDQPGMRIGVSQGSSSQAALTRLYKHASVVPAPTLQAAAEMLRSGQIDAFATNKGILFELADGLPGARVLPGRWGLESLALAVPKGREAARAWLATFTQDMAEQGHVQRAAQRAGLRGTAPTK